MKVKRNTLLLIACLVWGAAGFNILRLGVLAYPAYLSVLNFVLSVLVFAVFQCFIFGRLVKKHTARITGYEEERHFFLKFFDVKSFVIMAVMMSGGIWLRSSGIAPDRFIAVFYTGLGASLLTAAFASVISSSGRPSPPAKRKQHSRTKKETKRCRQLLKRYLMPPI